MNSQPSLSLMSPSQSTDDTPSGTTTNTITPTNINYKVKAVGTTMTETTRKRIQRKRESRARKNRKLQLSPGQTTMTQSFPTRSELRKLKEDERQLSHISKKPHPFDPRDEIPDASWGKIPRIDEEFCFKEFLRRDERQKELKKGGQQAKKKIQKKEVVAGDTVVCAGCGFGLTKCHNVRYGRYCIDAVRAHYYNAKAMEIETSGLVFRKIFTDHYNYAMHFDTYDPNDALTEVKWKMPAECLERFSCEPILEWMEWKKNGGWLDKKGKIPDEWHNY